MLKNKNPSTVADEDVSISDLCVLIKYTGKCEIWSSDNGVVEDLSIMDCYAVSFLDQSVLFTYHTNRELGTCLT